MGQQTFFLKQGPVKGHVVNSLGLVGHKVSVATIHRAVTAQS